MKTFVIAPHLDDEAISCGGLIQARIAAGGTVYVLAIYGRKYDYGMEDQRAADAAETEDFLHSCAILGCTGCYVLLPEGEPHQVGYYKVLFEIERALKGFDPDEVICPAHDDLNQDHRFLHHVVGIALRPVNLGSVSRVLEFFALDGSVRQPNYFVPLTSNQGHTKLDAIAAYRREARGGTSPRAPTNVMAQMQVWGAACGSPLAEAYRLRFAREIEHAGGDHGSFGVHRDKPDAPSRKD
jgi:LmbE family N-acetylglucosaminyl deacetylase